MRKVLAAAAATGLLAVIPIVAAIRAPVALNPGDSITITCPVKTVRDVSNAGRTVKVTCPGTPASAPPAVSPTPIPTPSSTLSPTPRPTPSPSPAAKSVRVTSMAGLLAALADNTVDEIVVADGIYTVPSRQLTIDSRYAARTRPVLVRAETVGGVTISGGGATNWLGLHFTQGVHDQTWQGFRFANAEPTQTGVIVFGQSGSVTPAGPHHITLLDITIEPTITSRNPGSGDHAMYFSSTLASAPTHDIVIDRYSVNGAGGVNTAITFYVQPALGVGPRDVIVRHATVTGTRQAFEFWDASLLNVTVEDSTVTNARESAVRYELGGTIVLRNVISTGSPNGRGFYSSLGPTPPGVTFVNCSLK